ncbi:MAG: nucleoside deaminase [Bacteroidetes bacterium]|nr:MAG: nucleoside deaminase [Bacteroidota bacterium]
MDLFSDEYFMRQAIIEAQKAFDKDEVPIGAVIVSENRIIARAHNLTEQLNDFTAHAEMQAYTSASNYLGSKFLNECTLYVTLEPCIMCAGAGFWTRIGRIVYGASDIKRGFLNSKEKIIHKKTTLVGGVLELESAKLITEFFINKRK